MDYLKEYAGNIIIISVLSTVFQIIIPDGKQKKYVTVVIGLIVMLVVMEPLGMIAAIKDNFFEVPRFEFETSNESLEKSLVADRFEINLADKIIEKVRLDTGAEISCQIKTERNEKGEIMNFEKVEISPYKKETAKYIGDEFGIDESVIEGEEND